MKATTATTLVAEAVPAAGRAALLAVACIEADPDQPRKLFDADSLTRLGKSMAKLGQLQPIAVRPAGPGRYRLIAGERRWRAAQLVGLTHLHTMIFDLDEHDVLPRAVAENLGRVDMTPLEEAAAFAELEADGWTRTDVAEIAGKSVQYVGYRIDLLNLIGPAREALNRGHLRLNSAWYVCRLSPTAQQTFLHKLVRGEFATAADEAAFAQACRLAENNVQDGFFAMQEMTDEHRAKVAGDRQRIKTRVDRLAGAGQVLYDLSRTDPAELAQLLAGLPGGVAAYRQRIEHLRDLAAKTVSTLRRAAAIAAVAGVDTPAGGAMF